MVSDEPRPTLEDAIALALNAHRGLYDKAGEPYILHPLRLLARFRDRPAQLTAAET
jgi:(p)ppGpp synthase/HD superfamily hydrolase